MEHDEGLGNGVENDDVYEAVLRHEQAHLLRIAAPVDLFAWRDAFLTEMIRPNSPHTRTLGPFATPSAQPIARQPHTAFLDAWSAAIRQAMQRLQSEGAIGNQSDPRDLATAILAAIHGGAMLARIAEDNNVLADALNVALDQLQIRGNHSTFR